MNTSVNLSAAAGVTASPASFARCPQGGCVGMTLDSRGRGGDSYATSGMR
jgi:hypothetical protein